MNRRGLSWTSARAWTLLPLLALALLFGAGLRGDIAWIPAESASLTEAAVEAEAQAAINPARTPFGPGERLEYQVKLGVASVGQGHMEVVGIDTIRGRPAYHVLMAIRGGLRFVARVDNSLESWMDVQTLASHRFIQDQDELRTKRYRQFDFFHDTRRFVRADGEESGTMITNLPLDDISFVYYARTLPLEVGQVYTLNQYFRPDRNPVILQVLRRDQIRVPAGTFNTIVVRPIIRTRGLFSEGGEAEIHFTDDSRRLMVYMQSRVPGMNLSLHLREYRPGRPLRPME
jgi:hypothetical protein